MQLKDSRGARLVGLLTAALIATTACASGSPSVDPVTTSDAPAVTSAAPLVVSVEGGLVVLDGATLEVLAEFDTESFTRVNPVGDGQHVLVTTSEGFQVLDAVAPELTDLVFAADSPGHVVRHGGHTVLFADGSGETTIFDTDALTPAVEDGELPETEVWTAPEPHHGVSIVLENGDLVTTVGNADSRDGIVVLDEHRDPIAENHECPGVHGEGTAADEAVVFGCEDGALLYVDGVITKLQAPDAYGRMGNAYVSETSQYIIGDYKDDPDAEGYLLHNLVVIDTVAATFDVVPLPEGAEYTWRDVARGPGDLAYVLATDGSIHVFDPATGEFTSEYPVVAPWEGPSDWQLPHPAIVSDGQIAYVTEPATDTVHLVDLATGEILVSAEIPGTPNELAIALG